MTWITEVRLTGHHQKDASIKFKQGPNVLSGDSDTGKSYILKCIDYILGADEMTKVIDEAANYEEVWLELKNNKNDILTLKRHLSGGDIAAFSDPIDNILSARGPVEEQKGFEIFKPKRQGSSSAKDITSRVLPFWNIPDDIQLRKNDQGETQRLTVRTLLPVILKDEFSIIEERSPIIGDGFGQTAKKRMFSYLLTGLDDSNVITQKQQKAAQSDTKAKLSLIEDLISPIEKRLGDRSTEAEESDSLRRLEATIEDLSNALSQNEEEINRLQNEKIEQSEIQRHASSQIIAINELLSRYQLLEERYQSDLNRLDFISEGSHYFGGLQIAICPCCGQEMSEQHICSEEAKSGPMDSQSIYEAARAEASKIRGLQKDLSLAIIELEERKAKRQTEQINSSENLTKASDRLANILKPLHDRTRSNIDDLVKRRVDLNQTESDREELKKLKIIRDDLAAKLESTNVKHRWSSLNPMAVTKLCKMIEGVLKEWSWSSKVRVEFDETNYDIKIDGKTRRSHGQGYRAVYNAAYLLGLQRYCKEYNKPHPKFVILDTPLNAMKQRNGDRQSIEKEVKEQIDPRIEPSFWKSISNACNETQIIIVENKEPPTSLGKKLNLQLFVGPSAQPGERAGFIPD